jgi:dTDP-4-amino-4,6-dideoxy-D-galactose acyltransferase
MDDPCEYLEWDSRFFGFRIARVTTNRLTPERLKAIRSWCEAMRIACLYFLADSSDRRTAWLAHEASFRLVDLRVTLESDVKGLNSGRDAGGTYAVRPSTPADIQVLRTIARQSHHASRFYYDPNFPTALCDALYETWITKSCEGYADVVLVPELGGRVAGYVSCHLGGNGTGRIGLLAVAPDAQSQGIGRLLVEASRRWFAQQGMGRATVVTQGRNADAQRLYQRGGFITRSVEEWHHRWFEQPATGGGQ